MLAAGAERDVERQQVLVRGVLLYRVGGAGPVVQQVVGAAFADRGVKPVGERDDVGWLRCLCAVAAQAGEVVSERSGADDQDVVRPQRRQGGAQTQMVGGIAGRTGWRAG